MDLLGEFDSEKKAKLSAELLAKEKELERAEEIIKKKEADEEALIKKEKSEKEIIEKTPAVNISDPIDENLEDSAQLLPKEESKQDSKKLLRKSQKKNPKTNPKKIMLSKHQ